MDRGFCDIHALTQAEGEIARRPGLKHGMKLAAISGVKGPFSDADIFRVRELALAARSVKATAQMRKLRKPRAVRRNGKTAEGRVSA